MFVLAGPREKFTEGEMNHLKKYLEGGGSILVLLGEGGEKKFDTNLNFFLEEYGIMVNNDGVVRTNYHKYFHPKGNLSMTIYFLEMNIPKKYYNTVPLELTAN